MDINDAQQRIRALMNEHGQHHVILGWMNENDKLGMTESTWLDLNGHNVKVRTNRILMNERFVRLAPWPSVRLVALHEIAHAIDNEGGHGDSWSRIVVAIGGEAKTGCSSRDMLG